MNKTVLLATLIIAPNFLNICQTGLDTNGYIALRIKAILNNSESSIALPSHAIKLTIKNNTDDDTKHIVLLKEQVDIPFVSITEYIKEYAKGAQGRAYIPVGALLIKVADRMFGLWENEKGVMCSPAHDAGLDEESWPNKLFNNLNKRKTKDNKDISDVLKLLLLVDKKGNLSLENLKTFSRSK